MPAERLDIDININIDNIDTDIDRGCSTQIYISLHDGAQITITL